MGLTSAQKRQLREAMVKTLKSLDTADLGAGYTQLGTLMSASTFDAEAARALIAKMEDTWRKFAPALADAVAEARAQLTDEQVAKALGVLSRSQPRLNTLMQKLRSEAFSALTQGVTLTPAQEAGLQALIAKDQEAGEARLATMVQAEGRYLRNEDKQALSTAFADAIKLNAGKEAIAWAATLDAQQRQKVVENARQYMQRFIQAMSALLQAD
jgi:Spy/CpxP family protein refolding chaperone